MVRVVVCVCVCRRYMESKQENDARALTFSVIPLAVVSTSHEVGPRLFVIVMVLVAGAVVAEMTMDCDCKALVTSAINNSEKSTIATKFDEGITRDAMSALRKPVQA